MLTSTRPTSRQPQGFLKGFDSTDTTRPAPAVAVRVLQFTQVLDTPSMNQRLQPPPKAGFCHVQIQRQATFNPWRCPSVLGGVRLSARLAAWLVPCFHTPSTRCI